jgi:hypothetical protein
VVPARLLGHLCALSEPKTNDAHHADEDLHTPAGDSRVQTQPMCCVSECITLEAIPVHEGAASSSQLLGHIAKGETIAVTHVLGEWLRIQRLKFGERGVSEIYVARFD